MMNFPWSLQETAAGEFLAFNVVNGETHTLHLDSENSEPLLAQEQIPEYEPRYEALSYTWGKDTILEFAAVEICGQQDQKLGLRPNLASALRHLRLPADIRVLWIDAICINQDDVEERNKQVKRMTDIYTLAHRVVAWLGDEEQSSEQAFAVLRHVGRQLRSTKSGRVIAAPNAEEKRLWRNDTPPSFSEHDWQAVMTLVQRPWFYRIWCWQEIKLGGHAALLQCGPHTIHWNDFWLAILCLHNKDTSPSRLFREQCRHIIFLKYEDQPVSNLMDVAKSKGCADPRDKVYGLLGITPAYLKSQVTVDYRKPVKDVYREAFMAHLCSTLRLDLLKHCDLSNREIGGPSWVPDWSRTEFTAPILSEQISAGLSRAWFTGGNERPELLEVIGARYTTVRTVSDSVASKLEEETLLVVKDWYRQLPQRGAYPGGEDLEAAFILTLCMNVLASGIQRITSSLLLSGFQCCKASFNLTPTLTTTLYTRKGKLPTLYRKSAVADSS
jgi:hypothetical protein